MSRKKTDEAMKEIRERGRKTAVISTVESFDLLDRPKDVDKQYSWYSSNYLALKEVDDFLDELKRQTIKLESCVRGAIVGGYGYGKTATGIYLWKRTENEGIIATPPFSWGSFQDLIDGVYGWVRYRLTMEPKLKKELDGVYSKYKEKSLNSVAKRMDVSVENLRRLDKYQINALLKWTPEEVLSFLSKVDGIITEGRFKGLVVFTDELQSTIERYPSVSRFMDDLFHLANGLKRRKGSYGIIFEMPSQTELVIADARGDVVDRLRERKLYLRCEDMFRREFPGQLWEYYGSELYDFEPWSITSRDTLDSLCQIAFRDDLGSGPRSVIEAFAAIANRWLEKGIQYSPVDLVSSYLAKEISFAKGERLIRATQEQLDSSIIAGNKEREEVIKLLAAFPEYGCPSETLERLELKGVLEELLIKEKVYGQVIQELSEGYTLTALMKHELPLEKTYERIIREFARRYSEDEENLELAFEAFAQACLQRIFKPHEKGPQPISGRWKTVHFKQDTGYVEVELSGSFSPSYPRRLVRIVVSCVEPDTSATKGDIL
ncbi:MAG: hypothetical protein KAW09_03205, partial [Thermoplasmata archaeon]|nr:hypothetical protein [Thermoplasmata archaeon]